MDSALESFVVDADEDSHKLGEEKESGKKLRKIKSRKGLATLSSWFRRQPPFSLSTKQCFGSLVNNVNHNDR